VRLYELVETSRRVGGESGRLSKVGLLAGLLGRLEPGDVEIAVGFLSGKLRQGRTGLGGAALRDARPAPAGEPSLSLREVDETFARIQATSGPGSAKAFNDVQRSPHYPGGVALRSRA